MADDTEKVGSLQFDDHGTVTFAIIGKAIVLTRADVRNLINQLEREESGNVHSRA